MSRAPDIVLLAHGSPDPRHAAGLEDLAARVRETSPSRAVHTAYLDHHRPAPRDAADELAGRAVVVPVLLTPAHHARVDVPSAVAEMSERADVEVALAVPLGPHPLLLDGVEELLSAAGVAPGSNTAVVVYAAGSSDSDALATVAETIRRYPRPGWGPWVVAALDGGASLDAVLRGLPDEVERTVAVSFMVAEGVLRDRMAQACGRAGVPMVPGALSRTRAMARLVLERADNVTAPVAAP